MGADGAVIQVVTRCRSAEEFIERFAAFTTETDIAVPVSPDVSEGLSGFFVICLEDGSAMMKGRCEVTAVPSEPALMRLRLREMDAHSAGTHLRMMEWRAFSPDAPAASMPEATVTLSQATPAPEVTHPPAPPLQSESEGAPADVPVDLSAVTVVRETNPTSDNETTAVSPLPEQDAPAASEARARMRLDLDRARRIGRRVAPYAAGLVVGLLLGIAIEPASKPTVVTVAPNCVPPPAAAQPHAKAPAPVAPPQSEALEPTDDPTPAARQRKERSFAKVIVTSSPEHALLKVNRHRMGRAPREISAPRFQRVRIEASLPGYQRWKKTIYVEEAELKLDVKLVRTREVEARRTVAPSAPPVRATAPSSVGLPGAVAAR